MGSFLSFFKKFSYSGILIFSGFVIFGIIDLIMSIDSFYIIDIGTYFASLIIYLISKSVISAVLLILLTFNCYYGLKLYQNYILPKKQLNLKLEMPEIP